MDSVELLVNVTPNETRIALVETGLLKEVHIERQGKRGIVGNIYKGRVTRVLPGMQSAFVDIGLEKAAFLHASDIVSHTECVDENEKKQTLDKYIQLLSSGGNDFPMEQLKKAGVDLSKIETIEAVAKQFDSLLDKLEVEIGKL